MLGSGKSALRAAPLLTVRFTGVAKERVVTTPRSVRSVAGKIMAMGEGRADGQVEASNVVRGSLARGRGGVYEAEERRMKYMLKYGSVGSCARRIIRGDAQNVQGLWLPYTTTCVHDDVIAGGSCGTALSNSIGKQMMMGRRKTRTV